MLRTSTVFLIAIGLLGLGLTVLTRRVVGDDMAPTINSGDFVVVIPTSDVLPGDVVVLPDPLDSSQTILRRVMGVGGQTVTIADGHIKVGRRRLRTTAMGDMGPYLVAKETLWAKKPDVGASWLTRHQTEPVTHWKAEPIDVPDGMLYLLADDRDHAVDSRWWGPVSLDQLHGVVRVRLGPKHTWRPTWEFLTGSPPLGA